MNDYTKGILTGASLILCFFMFVSAKSQSKNLGDIEVSSIRVLNDKGELRVEIGTLDDIGYLMAWGSDNKATVYLSGSEYPNASVIDMPNVPTGFIYTLAGGKKTAYFGGGFLATYNNDGVMTGKFGTQDKDGVAILFDRDGEAGWVESGKK